jgi:hypothetical protein
VLAFNCPKSRSPVLASPPAATALGSYTPFPTAQVCFTGSTHSSNSTIRHLPSTSSWICIIVLRYSARSVGAAPPKRKIIRFLNKAISLGTSSAQPQEQGYFYQAPSTAIGGHLRYRAKISPRGSPSFTAKKPRTK